MYNNPYFIPVYPRSMITPNLVRGALPNIARNAATSSLAGATKSAGLFSRLGSTLSGIKSINWGGLINNTSKTLGIINQTIPIVRQVGPMVNNMRSMFKVASIFKSETAPPIFNTRQSTINTTNPINTPSTTTNTTNTPQKEPTTNTYKKEEYSESPTFFINT